MPLLVTGSSTQLGREIARQLAPEHPVIGLDVVPGPRTTHTGRLTDGALIERLAGEVDAIIHTADLAAPDLDAEHLAATRLLLEAASARRHRRFVYTSATSVYGAALEAAGVRVTEALAPAPRDARESTRLEAEALCRAAVERGLATAVLRTAPLHPDEAERVAAARLHDGIDPRDAAAAHLAALAGAPAGAVLNVAARSPFGADDLAELRRDPASAVARHLPEAPAALASLGWRLPAIGHVIAIDGAVEQLGWRPRHGLDSLLRLPGRWLYHLIERAAEQVRGDLYAPDSLADQGFVHCSYGPDVRETARLHFPASADLVVLQIDPRRLGLAVEDEPTPRGPMPHLFGPVRAAAVTRTRELGEMDAAPDRLA
ncbi:MAG TPA: DUF952 domain-containing protein [Kofleriaceae bacterium]|nr:DUF952 domain-containing protein [Kofleriaceae bacterium]